MLLPGDRLPSERWLCDELGVSRATVRRAIEELINDGLVETRGRGSFVSGDALVEPPNTLMSLSELGRSRGLDAERARAARRRAPRDDRRGGRVRHRPRRRAVRARARCACSTACRSRSTQNRVPLRLLPDATGLDFTAASLYEALDARGPRRPRGRTTSSRRAPQTPHEAELLGLAPDAPVLFATTVAIGEDGRVVDLGRTVYRADRYRFQATLMRRAHR